MEEIKMHYFEIMERLENALPSTVECDYTKISPDELWEKVLNFLDETNINFSNDILQELEKNFKFHGSKLYKKTTHLLKNLNEGRDLGFDQNHYFIKETVAILKTMLMEKIYKQRIHRTNGYFKKEFGEEADVRKHISEEAIKRYVMNMLIITTEKGAGIQMEFLSRFVQQIFLYFGIETTGINYYNEEAAEEERIISNIIEDIKYNSTDYHGTPKQGDMGIEYESSSLNMDRFNQETQKAIIIIVKYITQRCQTMLREGISMNKAYDEYQKKQGESSKIVTKSPLIDQSQNMERKEENPTSKLNESDFDRIMTMFGELEKLIAANKIIISQLAEIEKSKQELEAQLEKNNAKITEMMSRGTK